MKFVLQASILILVAALTPAFGEHVIVEEAKLPISEIQIGQPERIEISPREFTLSGPRQRLQLVVTAFYPNGETADLTRACRFELGKPDLAEINERGSVTPQADGLTEIRATAGERSAVMKLTIQGVEQTRPVSFRHQILPVMARTGCSSAACHGAPHGKGKFLLSLHGLDAPKDHFQIADAEFGRRINLLEPEQSLLSAKPRTEIAHEGGQKLRDGDFELQLLLDWIGKGAELDLEAAECVGIRATPSEGKFIRQPHHVQQMRVEADFADGSVRDVTHLASFETSDETICKVSRHGLAVGLRRGEVAVVVRYLNHVETPMLSFVEDVPGFTWKAPEPANYIDEHVYAKLKEFQYLPGKLSNDEVFLRRVYLDVTGLLPTPDEVLYFLENDDPDKRTKLIDELLATEAHTAFWAQKWGDLLKLSTRQMGYRSVFKFHRWIEQAVAENMPYDEFAKEILVASGSNLTNPTANFYRTGSSTADIMESTAQLFLGTRIGCAKCHNHPYERWTQDNYYGLSAFFHRIKTKKTGRKDEVVVWTTDEGEMQHPATKAVMKPWAPKAGEFEVSEDDDRRQAFANWLTNSSNPYFAQVEANRIWTHLLGRGIVEPFDDFRDSNPPANQPLLTALTEDFVASGFDRRNLIRTILHSNTYQATSRANAFNQGETRFFSHYQPRRLTAEQLIDALGELTGVPKRFEGVPVSTKATQLPAPDLKPHDRTKLGDIEFLKVFGMPERQTVCECERGDETSLGQALELFNGGTIHGMLVNPENRFHRAVKENRSAETMLTELYLRAYARRPSAQEMEVVSEFVRDADDTAKAYEDLVWALINKDEFLYQH